MCLLGAVLLQRTQCPAGCRGGGFGGCLGWRRLINNSRQTCILCELLDGKHAFHLCQNNCCSTCIQEMHCNMTLIQCMLHDTGQANDQSALSVSRRNLLYASGWPATCDLNLTRLKSSCVLLGKEQRTNMTTTPQAVTLAQQLVPHAS